MLTVVYLGTGAAVPAPGRDNTSLALDDGAEVTLIDTSGSPVARLNDSGVPASRLARVIITHEHPDHTYGLPALLQNLWLTGRTEPLPIFALEETWPLIDRVIAAYWPDGWSRGFLMQSHVLAADDRPFVETERLSLWSARSAHSVPCIGIRAVTASGATVVYSSDTAPSDAIVELGRSADLLVHESTFLAGQEELAGQLGHSTCTQAARVAARAGASRLALVHFSPASSTDLDALLSGATPEFAGPIDVPNDGDRIVFDGGSSSG